LVDILCEAQRLGCALLLLPAAFKEPCTSWFSLNKVSIVDRCQIVFLNFILDIK